MNIIRNIEINLFYGRFTNTKEMLTKIRNVNNNNGKSNCSLSFILLALDFIF